MVMRVVLFALMSVALVAPASLVATEPSGDQPDSARSRTRVEKPSKPQIGESSENPATTIASRPSQQRRQRRQQWERTLQAPADLTVNDQQPMTLGGLLDQIRVKHGLQVKIDSAHILPLALSFKEDRKSSSGRPPVSLRGLMPSPIPAYGVGEGVSPATSYYPKYEPRGYEPAGENAVGVPPSALAKVKPDTEEKPGATPTSRAILAAIENESEPDTTEASAEIKVNPESSEPSRESANPILEAMKSLLAMPVDATLVAQPTSTVEEVLLQAIDQAFPLQAMVNESISEEMPMAASLSQATEWDLLVQDNGILITTRLNANLQKETRVYSLRELEKSTSLKAEDVARVVTRTIRPWSWKQHFPEAATETQSAAPARKRANSSRKFTVPKVNLDLLGLLLSSKTSQQRNLRLVSDEAPTFDSESTSSNSEKTELTEEDLELIGRAWEGLFQGTVASLQVIYHAEPPTGVVQVVPGMLIISQSQGAHREIADLLEQLAHPDN